MYIHQEDLKSSHRDTIKFWYLNNVTETLILMSIETVLNKAQRETLLSSIMEKSVFQRFINHSSCRRVYKGEHSPQTKPGHFALQF